ncbi:MAG: hypothetical protein K6G11_05000 [Lachnospiraceae bacterium]|nr:hypothetical protein [Lachnospiraceae bacterium]
MDFSARSLGLAIGVIVGLIVTVVILKLINKDGNTKTKYDEMQLITRGKAYTYAFWTLIIIELFLCITSTGDYKFPFNNYVLHFSAIIIGIVVQVSYCIWHNAYFGLNNSKSRFAIFAILIAVFNFGIALYLHSKGELIVDGVFQDALMNIIVGCMFIVIGIELFVKMIVDKGEMGD